MKIILLNTIFDFFNAIFLLTLIFAVLFIIIVVLIVLKLMKINVNTKINKKNLYKSTINTKVANLESTPTKTIDKEKICLYCGSKMDEKAKYCENCGVKLLD